MFGPELGGGSAGLLRFGGDRPEVCSFGLGVGNVGDNIPGPFFWAAVRYTRGMSMVERIRTRLTAALQPAVLEIVDESHMHNVPDGAESHFNVFVVSEAFEGMRMVAQHQAVYRALQAEMAGSIHALALKTMPASQHAASGGSAAVSPQCRGGSKANG